MYLTWCLQSLLLALSLWLFLCTAFGRGCCFLSLSLSVSLVITSLILLDNHHIPTTSILDPNDQKISLMVGSTSCKSSQAWAHWSTVASWIQSWLEFCQRSASSSHNSYILQYLSHLLYIVEQNKQEFTPLRSLSCNTALLHWDHLWSCLGITGVTFNLHKKIKYLPVTEQRFLEG